MILLFTLLPNFSCTKDNLIFSYNTKIEEGKFIELPLNTKDLFLSTSGIVYSGNYLCVGIQTEDMVDDFLIVDIYSGKSVIFECSHAKNIGSIISLYPGKLYLDSRDTNSIISVDFDSVNLSYFNDSIHYTMEKNQGIKSLCNHNNNWFLALQKNNKIIDLTNDRVVYSDIDLPNNLFFNKNQRLCFLETERGLFHCGDDIFHVNGKPNCAIEDVNRGGYWISDSSYLVFIDYKGNEIETQDLFDYNILRFNNVVEAKGKFYYETV